MTPSALSIASWIATHANDETLKNGRGVLKPCWPDARRPHEHDGMTPDRAMQTAALRRRPNPVDAPLSMRRVFRQPGASVYRYFEPVSLPEEAANRSCPILGLRARSLIMPETDSENARQVLRTNSRPRTLQRCDSRRLLMPSIERKCF
jgi:hypothetical protein